VVNPVQSNTAAAYSSNRVGAPASSSNKFKTTACLRCGFMCERVYPIHFWKAKQRSDRLKE
jgi:hypothetical protein